MASPGQAIELGDFSLVVELLDAHGARGSGQGNGRVYDESMRWMAARFLLVCLPKAIFSLNPIRDKFVPVIRTHLEELGLPRTNDICLVMKGVSEQLIYSSPTLSASLNLKAKRKYGVSDIRAQGVYGTLLKAQNGRCAVCGISLDLAESVELDHIVPFSFIGDISDGSNWRLLCGRCNQGKHDFLSSWLSPDAWNWPSSGSITDTVHKATSRARYAVLATRGTCEVENCGKGPEKAQLVLVRRHTTGLHVPSNLGVVCEVHSAETANTQGDDIRAVDLLPTPSGLQATVSSNTHWASENSPGR